jgi:CTP synthase (UTP-ammonia lyase)
MYQKLRKKMLSFQVCIVELGGTIGDIEGMPFVEAFRQFQFRVRKENFVCAHVSMVPQVS